MKFNTLIKGIKGLLVAAMLATPLMADSKVIGYYPYWGQYTQFSPEQVKYEYYTDIVYGYFVANDEGGLSHADANDQPNFESLQKHAQDNKVNLLASIGGPGAAESFETIASDEALRSTFAQNVAKLVTDNNLAGVEISWEYPTMDQKDDFTALITAVKTALAGKSLIVSVSYKDIENYDVESLKQADFINVIALDMSTADADVIAPNCDAVAAIKSLEAWSSAGLDKSKLILTVPFYGRTYLKGKELGGSHDGTGSGNEGMVNWVDLMTKFDGKEYTVSFDEATKSEIAVSEIEAIVFNGIPSVKYMAEEVKKGGYAGMQFADLAGEHKEPIVSLSVAAVKVLRPSVEIKVKK